MLRFAATVGTASLAQGIILGSWQDGLIRIATPEGGKSGITYIGD
jgi:hypothetical protein